MNLWLSSHFLVAGLFLSSWALTPEECQPLLTPLSLADHSMYYGRWNLIMGYTENEGYNAILKASESVWMNVVKTTSNHDSLVTSHNRMNGTCVTSEVNSTTVGNTISGTVANVSTVFNMLPSCDSCMVMNVNVTARDLDRILHMLKIDTNVTGEEVKFRAVYLAARESTLKDSDLEHFKQQASCIGFSREPNFLYDSKNDFCAEDEGIKITF